MSGQKRTSRQSLDHLVRLRKQRSRDSYTERLSRLEIDRILGRCLNREVSGFLAFKNTVDVTGGLPMLIPTVPFSVLDNLPLVLFCRPSSWRNHLEQISAERGVSLNVALEADSLSLQTHIVSGGGVYALLGPYAIASASKERRLQSSKLVAPVVTRNIALAVSRHGELTLACRTVMQIAREIAKSGAAGLRRKEFMSAWVKTDMCDAKPSVRYGPIAVTNECPLKAKCGYQPAYAMRFWASASA